MTTLSRREVLNLRSGQTVHSVYGNKSSDLYVRTVTLCGKRSHTRPSLLGVRDWREYKCKNQYPGPFSMSWWPLAQGDRHSDSRASSVGGALGDRYFTTARAATRFMNELKAGLHPLYLEALDDHMAMCDELDEKLGICDRGLGYWENRDYAEDLALDLDDLDDPSYKETNNV